MNLRRIFLWSWRAGRDFGDLGDPPRKCRDYRKVAARRARKREKRIVTREIAAEAGRE